MMRRRRGEGEEGGERRREGERYRGVEERGRGERGEGRGERGEGRGERGEGRGGEGRDEVHLREKLQIFIHQTCNFTEESMCSLVLS